MYIHKKFWGAHTQNTVVLTLQYWGVYDNWKGLVHLELRECRDNGIVWLAAKWSLPRCADYTTQQKRTIVSLCFIAYTQQKKDIAACMHAYPPYPHASYLLLYSKIYKTVFNHVVQTMLFRHESRDKRVILRVGYKYHVHRYTHDTKVLLYIVTLTL